EVGPLVGPIRLEFVVRRLGHGHRAFAWCRQHRPQFLSCIYLGHFGLATYGFVSALLHILESLYAGIHRQFLPTCQKIPRGATRYALSARRFAYHAKTHWSLG